MTHLRIEQNNNQIEQVNSSIIQKLYDLDKAGLDLSSNLKGRLHAAVGYREVVNYLTQKYPELFITVDDYAIPFEDSKMLEYLNSIGVGSDGFVTEQQAAQATIVANSVNTTVKKFNEFKYFTNITSSRTGFTGANSGYMRFHYWTALEEIDISNLMSIGHNNGYGYEDTFNNCTALKTVKASDKLRQIGFYAFRQCTNLEEISGLEGRIEVCQEAFIGCSKLTSDNFDNVQFVLGLYTNSKNSVFENCSMLQNITLHADTTMIPVACFNGCSSLKSISGTDNVVQIQGSAFKNCYALESIGTSFGNVTFTASETFRSCKNLKTFPVTGLTISFEKPTYQFYDCNKLERIGTGGDNVDIYVSKIGDCFMRACRSLTGTLNFPITTEVSTSNSGGAFSQCQKIEKVSFPALVILDGGSAWEQNYRNTFGGDTMLKVVDVGSNTTFLSQYTFYDNPQMKAFIIRSTTPPTIGDGTTAYAVDVMGNSTVNVYVPDEALSTYQNTIPYSGWGNQLKPLSQFDESQIQYDYLQQTTEP